MKVIYLPIESDPPDSPWQTEFVAAASENHDVVVYERSRPFEEQVAGCRVVVDNGGTVATTELLDAGAAAGVELWQAQGTGLDHFPLEHALGTGMKLANTPGIFTAIALAEHAIFLMLCINKDLWLRDRDMRRGYFVEDPLSDELYGKTLGLVGFGASGRELALRARALGMRLLAMDSLALPAETADEYGLDLLGGSDELDTVLGESDFVSIHVPLTAETRHMIDARAIGLMKPTATLINVARGPVVDESALLGALREGRLHGAGLDVFETEPLPLDHPFLEMDNVILTPHKAGATLGSARRRGRACADNVSRIEQGLPPLYEIRSTSDW